MRELPPMVISASPEREPSWSDFFAAFARRWRPLVGAAAAAALLAAVVALFLPKRYRAEASFIPQVRQSNGAIGGIAAQLGVDVSTSDPTQTPHFFVDLLKSPEFLGKLDGAYPTREGQATLRALIGVDSSPSLNAPRRVGNELARRISTLVTPRTGVISIGVELQDPVAAVALLDSMLSALDDFNVEVRRSRAQAERVFTELRASQLREELLAAEARLEDFLTKNRVAQTPELAFQRDRLARDVALRQQVYSTMVQAFEQARIDEVRDTPVITRLSGPALLPRPVGPRPLAFAATAAILVGSSLFAFLAWGELRVSAAPRSRAGA